MPPRIVTDHLLYQVKSGAVHLQRDQRVTRVREGQTIWVQPAVRYSFSLDENQTVSRLLYTRFHVGKRLPYRLEEEALVVPTDRHLQMQFEQLLAPMSVGPAYESTRIRSALCQLLIHMMHLSESQHIQKAGLTAPAQQAALQYIHEHLADRFTIADVAKHVGLNPAYFSLQFRKRMDQTPQAYIKRARIEESANLLRESNLRIGEVAARMGYDDVFFFSHQFKNVMGKSPRLWRASQQ